MNSLTSIALSGLQAARQQAQSSAHNLANLQTPGFRREQVVQSAVAEGGVDAQVRRSVHDGAALEADLVNQLAARLSYRANLAVYRTADRMAGALLDERA